MFVNSGLDGLSGLSIVHCAAYAGEADFAWPFYGQVIFDGTEQSRHFHVGRPNILMHLDSIQMMLKAHRWWTGGRLIVGWSLSEAGTECVGFVFGHILCLENGHECVVQPGDSSWLHVVLAVSVKRGTGGG
jgi:aryl carrier-like protein